MPYTSDHPPVPSSDELRERIPGWGADLDPADRPSVPRLKFDPAATGAHWDFPERQPEKRPRERSIEHEFLTPVFGTSTPTHGLSGLVRKYAYRTYSEGRAAHWLRCWPPTASTPSRAISRRSSRCAPTTPSPRPASEASSPTTGVRRASAPHGSTTPIPGSTHAWWPDRG